MNLLRNKSIFVLGVIAVATLHSSAADTGVRRINPSSQHAPHGYTHVVIARRGTTVYIAGQVPLDLNSKLVGPGDFEAQTRQVFENLKNALASAGASFSDVVSMNTYVTDISHIDKYRNVRDEYMKTDLPTASLVEVKALFRPDVMIEISVTALIRK